MKFILKTNNTSKFGTTNNLPMVGEVEFDETGLVEVELENEGELEQLLNAVPDLSEAGTKHVITVDDIKDNPELIEAGVKVGDEVIIPKEDSTAINGGAIEPQVEVNELGKAADEKTDIAGKVDAEVLTNDTEVIAGAVITDAPNAGAGEGTQIASEESDADVKSAPDPLANLEEKNMTELKFMCKDFPEAEWKKLAKPALLEYIVSKMTVKA